MTCSVVYCGAHHSHAALSDSPTLYVHALNRPTPRRRFNYSIVQSLVDASFKHYLQALTKNPVAVYADVLS